MAKDPAVLFYTGDFLIGVADMPYLERGYYITLLCLQHQKGHLSEETICFSLGLRSVSEIPHVIDKFEVDNDGKYYQHRMDEEAEKRATYSESRRINGKKGGRPKNHMDNHMGTHMGNENEDINKDENNSNRTLFIPPKLYEVQAYCTERNNKVDAESFVNFYASKGWLIGKNKMKDWKAAIRTWERGRENGRDNKLAEPSKKRDWGLKY